MKDNQSTPLQKQTYFLKLSGHIIDMGNPPNSPFRNLVEPPKVQLCWGGSIIERANFLSSLGWSLVSTMLEYSQGIKQEESWVFSKESTSWENAYKDIPLIINDFERLTIGHYKVVDLNDYFNSSNKYSENIDWNKEILDRMSYTGHRFRKEHKEEYEILENNNIRWCDYLGNWIKELD